MLLAAEMTKDVISTNNNIITINSNFVMSNGFRKTKCSNFNNSKTSKFMTEKEKTSNTFFKTNTKYGGFFNNKPKENLPDIRKKFDMKMKENLDLSGNNTNKTTSNNFYNRNNSKGKSFLNAKQSNIINDSVPKIILDSIFNANNLKFDLKPNNFQQKTNNQIVNY